MEMVMETSVHAVRIPWVPNSVQLMYKVDRWCLIICGKRFNRSMMLVGRTMLGELGMGMGMGMEMEMESRRCGKC